MKGRNGATDIDGAPSLCCAHARKMNDSLGPDAEFYDALNGFTYGSIWPSNKNRSVRFRVGLYPCFEAVVDRNAVFISFDALTDQTRNTAMRYE